MRNVHLGRHVFGLAAILFGFVTLAWRDFNIWQQVQPLGNIPHREMFACFSAVIQIFGGVAIQFRKTARIGALTLGGIYLAFALLYVPRMIAEPRVYTRYGGFFEEFSQVAGALIVYSTFARDDSERWRKLARTGFICFGLSVVSFTLEQIFYLSATADFVPKWIPPGQMFWAVTTTIAFALAAIALLTGRSALVASQLLTLMIVGFGLLIWLPAPFADPHQLINWAGNAQNLAIAGAAWIVMDFLSQNRAAAIVSTAATQTHPVQA